MEGNRAKIKAKVWKWKWQKAAAAKRDREQDTWAQLEVDDVEGEGHEHEYACDRELWSSLYEYESSQSLYEGRCEISLTKITYFL